MFIDGNQRQNRKNDLREKVKHQNKVWHAINDLIDDATCGKPTHKDQKAPQSWKPKRRDGCSCKSKPNIRQIEPNDHAEDMGMIGAIHLKP